MLDRQNMLKEILKKGGRRYGIELISRNSIYYPTTEDVTKWKDYKEVLSIYQETLKGDPSKFKINFQQGKVWDIVINLSGRIIAVELDEEQHFNRYRGTTFESKLYDRLPRYYKEVYKPYCTKYEHNCLDTASYGRKWTGKTSKEEKAGKKSFCEKQFGQAAPARDLSGTGSPRWKQRAFYDFIKDLSPLIISVSMARISIWDEIKVKQKSFLINDILKNDLLDAETLEALARAFVELIKNRILPI